MRLPPFSYLSPATLEEALDMMARHKGKVGVIAGGTDIVNRMRLRLTTPPYAMSLKGLPRFSEIKKTKDGLVISAGALLCDIAASPVIARFSALARAAGLVAAPPIRNVATIGGNILQETRCLFYDQSELVRNAAPSCLKRGGPSCRAAQGATKCLSVYQGDLAPALIALGTSAVIERSGSARTVPLEALFSGKGKKPFTIAPDELLTKIVIPVPKGTYASSYEKLRMRSALDYPIACASAFLSAKRGVIETARVVLGAAGPAPAVLDEASTCLAGRKVEDADPAAAAACAARHCRAIDNTALPASYRKKMAVVVASRAIRRALDGLKEGA